MIQSIVGIVAIVMICAALGRRPRAVRWPLVAGALGAQLVLGALLLRVPALAGALGALSVVVTWLEEAALAGASFMFGYLAGGPAPFQVTSPGAGFIIAFRVLPLILVVSALSEALTALGVLPWIIRQLARVLRRAFAVSGALALGSASSLFFGIIESPLLIRPHLATMRPAELLALMTCGMATIAGTVMVLYASVLEPVVPGALGHMVGASLLSVPAALVCSHLLMPDSPPSDADADADLLRDGRVADEAASGGLMAALMRGTHEGVKMVVAIAATLIVLFALVHLINRALGALPLGQPPWSLQGLLGVVLRPLVWMMGIPWDETHVAGRLMGTKTILNEFVAFMELAALPADALSARSRLLLSYGMCGFANLGSLGILVGGLGPLMPAQRQAELGRLALRALVGGTLATSLTAAVVGVVAPA